jgi:hypothetical protein
MRLTSSRRLRRAASASCDLMRPCETGRSTVPRTGGVQHTGVSVPAKESGPKGLFASIRWSTGLLPIQATLYSLRLRWPEPLRMRSGYGVDQHEVRWLLYPP